MLALVAYQYMIAKVLRSVVIANNDRYVQMINYIKVLLILFNFTFFLAVIYGPNTDTPTFYSNLKNRLLQTNGGPIICCGDWNLVLDFKKDTHAYV